MLEALENAVRHFKQTAGGCTPGDVQQLDTEFNAVQSLVQACDDAEHMEIGVGEAMAILRRCGAEEVTPLSHGGNAGSSPVSAAKD